MRLHALVLILGFPMFASASIGLDASSVAEDCKTLQGTLATISATHMTCKTQAYTIDFFLNSNQQVTRIAWQGRATPSLDTLLGSYSHEYKTALAALPATTAAGTRKMRHESQNLIVTRSGNGRLHIGEIVLKKTN